MKLLQGACSAWCTLPPNPAPALSFACQTGGTQEQAQFDLLLLQVKWSLKQTQVLLLVNTSASGLGKAASVKVGSASVQPASMLAGSAE